MRVIHLRHRRDGRGLNQDPVGLCCPIVLHALASEGNTTDSNRLQLENFIVGIFKASSPCGWSVGL